MYSFRNDYSEGAHPLIINALAKSNLEQTDGYGEDNYTKKAVTRLKEWLVTDAPDIHFFTGGTQTNLTALAAFLRPHEAIVAPKTGHILVHETGAIEATGHKIIAVETKDGKVDCRQLQAVLTEHIDEHMVKPKLVYISNPTEIGSIYSKQELINLRQFCDNNYLYLYVDGARLGSALCATNNDLQFCDLPKLTDAFYIGGTKGGALFGEALVICNNDLKRDFRFLMKQRGALLAKGRLLGIQFFELFQDGLYFTLAKHANAMATILQRTLQAEGYAFLIESFTNQLFPILPNDLIAELQKKYSFYTWAKITADTSAIRLVTSWATKEEAVWSFIEDVKNYRIGVENNNEC